MFTTKYSNNQVVPKIPDIIQENKQFNNINWIWILDYFSFEESAVELKKPLGHFDSLQSLYELYKKQIIQIIQNNKQWTCKNSLLVQFICSFFHRETSRLLSVGSMNAKVWFPQIPCRLQQNNDKKFMPWECKLPWKNYIYEFFRYKIDCSLNNWDMYRAILPTSFALFPVMKVPKRRYPYYDLVVYSPMNKSLV